MAEMSLFLVSQPECGEWGYFESMIVCAESAEAARKMHPECSWEHVKFSDKESAKRWKTSTVWAWSPDELKVRRLGSANRVARGIVLASYVGD